MRTSKTSKESDFWWLTAKEKRKYIYVELVYHKPLKEENDAPRSVFMNPPLVDVKNINQWRQRYQNTNVYRSLKVWADKSRKDALSGPFIIDIDNESENLSDALVVTKEAVECLRNFYGIKDDDIHIFFTGHKGFNLEIHPRALKIRGTVEEQENKTQWIRKEVIKKLQQGKNIGGNSVSERGTLIDPIHEHVRLHYSLNKWISKTGEITRMKIELPIHEFSNLIIEKSIAKSERS